MVIISKTLIPKCSQMLIAQLKICGNRNVSVNSNYEPMVYTQNIKQLCRILPLSEADLEIVKHTLDKPQEPRTGLATEEWPQDMLSSKRDIQDFVKQTPGLGLEDAIKRNQRTSLIELSAGFDYKNKQSVNLVLNAAKVVRRLRADGVSSQA